MQRIPTVRVKNPASPDSYMVINQSDLNLSIHELWPEQAHDYVEPAPVAPVDDLEATTAKRIFGKLMARQLGMSPEKWSELTAQERADYMLAEEANVDKIAAPLTPPVQGTDKPKTPSWKSK